MHFWLQEFADLSLLISRSRSILRGRCCSTYLIRDRFKAPATKRNSKMIRLWGRCCSTYLISVRLKPSRDSSYEDGRRKKQQFGCSNKHCRQCMRSTCMILQYLILENTKSDEIVSFRTLFEMFSTQIDDVMMSRCQNNERREEDFRIIS
jgi:hypothetical protein